MTAINAARRQREIQGQAGARDYPAPRFPKQHQRKPGSEAALSPAPFYDAPFYLGSGKLENKVALITGGDSGMGRAVAILFAREGADVAVAYLNEHQDAKVAKTVEELGGLDVLVNNAAFQVHTSRFEDLTAKHFDETLKTNQYGYFYMAQSAVKQMTTGGIHAFTRSLAAHLVPCGIRVSGVASGPVRTPLNPSGKEAKDVGKFGTDTPMKRPAQPEEIASAYIFLASPHCSSYITAEILAIIGGYNGGWHGA
jgi:NAD(P)-dependent dehydrogenase (short-subunit alcohol dehydrogenase family)